MSVPTGKAAREQLRDLLGDESQGTNPETVTRTDLAPDLTVPWYSNDTEGVHQDPPPAANWLWTRESGRAGRDPGRLLRRLRDPAAYDLSPLDDHQVDDAAWQVYVHTPPAEILAGSSFSGPEQSYCRSSVDVTMRGGVTSGVVYPPAICEIARSFRLRNIGGASAGAIAAAVAAAAERGRATQPPPQAEPTEPESPDAAPAATNQQAPTEAANEPSFKRLDPGAPRFRRGFAGLADATYWFSELEVTSGKDQFRVSQLFRPKPAALPLFRLIAASMQAKNKVLRMLALALISGGPWMVTARVVAVLLATALASRSVHQLDEPWRSLIGFGLLLGTTLGICAVGMSIALIIGTNQRRELLKGAEGAGAAVQEPVVPLHIEKPAMSELAAVVFLTLVAAGLLLAPALMSGFRKTPGPEVNWAAVFLISFVALGVQLALPLPRLWHALTHAKDAHFGLIPGSTNLSEVNGKRQKMLNWLAGMRTDPVRPALVPWLSAAMRDLAGLANDQTCPNAQLDSELAVLRFGHLWHATYEPPAAGEQVRRDLDAYSHVNDQKWHPPSPTLQAQSSNSQHRLVNLELVTTELVHGVPWRFPLTHEQLRTPRGLARLYVRRDDLEDVFPKSVVDALAHHPCSYRRARDTETGAFLSVDDLYELPDMAHIPVIVATRMSLSFPVLFEAIRIYARVRGPGDDPHYIRDDYGARLYRTIDESTGAPISMSFPNEAKGPEDDHWVDPPDGFELKGGEFIDDTLWLEELWFTDGGVTSNFPVHFFDSTLPLWPTLGINLGPHPRGHGHQDVWLPADNQSRSMPPAPVKGPLTGFFGAIFNAARGWHDNYETSMPAFRGRVAWVRQRSSEGGTNLFMDPQVISSLALRGALAGRRLRRRFEQDAYWFRHQWLRLRISADNLADQAQDLQTAMRHPHYENLLASLDGSILEEIRTDLGRAGADPTRTGEGVSAGDLDGFMEWFMHESGSPDPEAYWAALRRLLTADDDADPWSPLHQGAPEPRPVLRQVPPV
ncbi:MULTISPECIES: patatin-like phospholipase family protein [unclassified Nocardioides]|uniref:patatin-like phospholipase family protein n=1 Tax=unclassified Nocardioides TaxID=2615069 RepID=UPI0009EFD16B|nr:MULTISPECIES: patatin-like phospholipase family protein [unclassified Nocardioides]GAW52582.1 hypothetical protein PD653B2_4940 [Nocardioides sp. PD653-B2]GAW57593.1 hypothetical protein PD653_5038 [Nocardioides sp. PD653]